MDVIISKYKEKVDWVRQLTKSRIYIYDKSDEVNDFIKLPNTGREPHTFITHIINNYDDLSEYCCFLQGNPFDHMGTKDLSFVESFRSKDFFPIGNKDVRWPIDGELPKWRVHGVPPHWMEINKLLWDAYFINRPTEILVKWGGQFVVSKSAIQLRKKIFYEKLLNEMIRTDIPIPWGINKGLNKFPWILEGTWEYIFDKNYKTIYDNEK